MTQIYQKLFRSLSFLLVFATLCCNIAVGQTLTTAGGTNYGALSFVPAGTPGTITFVVQNSNAQGRILNKIDCFARVDQPDNVFKLWYSATSLSGVPTVAAPVWTLVATGTPVTVSTDGVTTVIDNINFAIPANTQYRFALETSNGIGYTGTTAGTPSPNSFTSGGCTLKVGSNLVAGQAVGYGGAFPNPVNTPRFFTGAVYLSPCTSTTVAATPVITPDTIACGAGNPMVLRVLSGDLNASGEWKWYSGSCGGTLVGTGDIITINPTATTTYFVRGEGGCASTPGPCASVTVTLRPVPGTPVINPVPATCLGSVQALNISPVAITPGSVTVNSAALSLAIPDNTANGVNNTLTVAGVPAGATITGIDVTLNITHTYISDLVINLKAPNGQVLNLDKYVTGTGNEGENFVNTVISSGGTDNLSAGTAPYTGIFKPDAINTNVGNGVQNPTGFVANAASYASLYSVPNGTYTLALADGGPQDLGTLTGWSITIKYTTSAPASAAVWSPRATLFVDPAGTVPYNGTTPLYQIYAKAGATTEYYAASFLNGCFSTPDTAILVVNVPASVSDATLPADAAVCEFGNAVFEAKGGGTSPSYQWVQVDGNGVESNITDNENFSGATTDSLTVKNVPVSWNGYSYYCKVTSIAPCTDVVNTRSAYLRVYATPVATLSTGAGPTALQPGIFSALSVSSDSAAIGYDWSKNGGAFDGATGNSFDLTVNDQGVYTVKVTDVHGCAAVSNPVEISVVESANIFIYPNPSIDGRFSVCYYSLKGNVLPRMLAIYDSKGAMVLKKEYTIAKPYDKMEVDFSHLSKGTYFVNLADRNGKRIATGKVVVH